jgi:hypothetical protein
MKKVGSIILALATTAALLTLTQQKLQADDDDDHRFSSSDRQRIEQGFRIAPVELTYAEEDRKFVGLGSYLVNAVGDCSGCHTNPNYAPGGDPYLGQPKMVNSKNYLAGGRHFGPFISRNLTPENGLPEGHTFKEFKLIMRTGIDLDKAHPQFGPLLQVMPWPAYQDMSNRDLRAIYEYLKAIPPAEPGIDPSAP